MKNLLYRIILFLNCIVFSFHIKAQTLIMNEVSNGPSGSQEYVEFVVVSDAVSYNCNSSTPPCIDIRGWIFDDNSGYHGTSGIAAGAIRFSQDPIWSCIPLGTIILIYNDADKNPGIPSTDDLSMADGNCTIIAPISNTSLFERNTTTPGAAACSYPATGWVAGGNWTYTALANTSDCARIVNLAGCEVFSVCYGATDNLNTLIYFPSSGTGTVYSFNGIDPQQQSNWTSGSATTMQTPGAPNNAANAAYIAQFNNGCLPITQTSVTAVSINAGCTCNGSATASASGSIGGYTYVWYDAGMNPIGQTGATATGLCAGVYNVIATSNIGCTATTSVTISSSSTTSVTVNSQTICAGTTAILTATPSAGGGSFSWTPGGQTTPTISVSPGSTTSYSVTYTLAGCSVTNNGIVNVKPLPTVTVNSPTICNGQTTTLTANGATTYLWNTGSTANPLIVSPTSNTNFTVTGTTNGCTNTAVSNVTVNAQPTITVNSPTICSGQTATITAIGATSYIWNTGATNNSLSVAPTTNMSFTVTGTANGCTNTAVSNLAVNAQPTITVNSPTICSGQVATITATGATSYTWNTGTINNSLSVSPLINTSYTVVGATNNCTNMAVSNVIVNSNPTLTVNPPSVCAGQTATLTATGAASYSWNTGAITNTISVSPTSTTNYTVLGISVGCTNTAIASVSVIPQPTITVNSATICSGQTATINATGATTYTWNIGSTTNPLSVTPTINTNYTVIGSSNGCTNTAVSNVVVIDQPTVTVNSSTICIGQSASLLANGASSYVWSTGSTSNSLNITPTSTTNYSVTGSTSGCTNSIVATVSVIPLPNITVNSTTVCSGQSATLTATGATNYTWSSGASINSITVSPTSNTNYTVVGATAGCTNSAVSNVSVTPLPTVSVNSTTLCFGSTTSLNAVGATSYTWSNGSVLNPLSVAPNSNTTYSVIGAALGCTNSAIASVTVIPLPNISVNSSTICSGQNATINASGASNYSWSTGDNTNSINVSPSTSTNYTVTGTTLGCSNTATSNILVTPLPIVTVNSNTLCVGQTVTLNASGANTYTWNTGSTTSSIVVSPNSNTSYSVVGAISGCTNIAISSISVTPLPTITVNSTTICAGSSASLSANGSTTYTWSTGSTTSSIIDNPLITSTYSVVGEQLGCVNSATAQIVVSPNLVLSVNAPTICAGQTATLVSSGATTYTWSNGTIGNTIIVSPSSTTSFSVLGTSGSCSGATAVNVVVNPLPLVSVNSNTICSGQTTTITATGATTYSWNNGLSSNFIVDSPLTNSTYTVIGSSLGCTNTAVASISVVSLPTLTVNSPTICSGQTTTLTVSGANSYSWSGGVTTNTIIISPVSSTVVSVSGVLNGCSNSTNVNISVIPNPTLSVNSATICEGTTTTLTAVGAASYVWNSGAMASSITVSPTTNTSYTVIGTTSGCSNTVTANISVTPLPTITVNSSTICAGQSATLIANGAASYNWNTGVFGNQIVVSPLINTTYSVIGTVAGCSDFSSAIVNVISPPILSVSSSTICAGESTTLSVSGANSFIWSNGATTNTIAVNPNTSSTYSVSGTSGICSANAITNIIVNQSPTITVTSPTICSGQTATITATGASSYIWNTGSSSNNLISSPVNTTIYTVTGTSFNCSATATTTVVVNASPIVAFNSNKSFGCAPLCVQFTDLSSVSGGTITNWSWSFTDGLGSNYQNPYHCFEKPGTYDIELFVTSQNGCSNHLKYPSMMTVYPNPTADFMPDVFETDLLNPVINFSNLSSNATDYLWNFTSVASSTLTNTSYTYSQAGVNTTTLIAKNNFGCKSIAVHDVVVKDIFTFYAPNTFTPNGDNVNDYFMPLGIGWDPNKYELDIFDRWGNNCFTTNEIGRGWDGRANNGSEIAQIDTYTWKVNLTDIFGITHVYVGRVTILK